MISRQVNLEHRKNLAEKLAGVQENKDVDWQ